MIFGDFIRWSFVSESMILNSYSTPVSALTEGTVVMLDNGIAIMRGNSSGVFLLQVNASTSLDGSQFFCTVLTESNTVTISVRGMFSI